jgi:purine-binding chemotaxis protein CheW
MQQTEPESASLTDDTIGIPILIFRIGSLRSALFLDCVVQVFDAVEVGDFPDSLPRDVLGLINIRGMKIPLVDLRRRWGIPGGKVQLSNQLIVIESEGINLSIIVDEVIGTRSVPLRKIIHLRDLLPDVNPHMAVADLDGILMLLDSEHLFSTDEFDELKSWLEAQ